ncbi:hypothetical protein SR870_09740 [Rhodopseudomonas palustris]|uniref:cell division protein FtsL n=1 Tax=Rhodopseudomonas palustris TaxID=1076 RepID=UPI002ACD9036|nr:hypothetical protein [Rhodopseudomonas palustris]WQH02009.1 hypothetical protein SR870_09740 [Rhodopseudomonas palustris]
MRLIHVVVIGMLVFAAAYVYRIKMDSTVRTEKVLQLHAEVRREREAIAQLRAEWAKLDAPGRLQGIAERHLKLKPIAARQFDRLKNLPARPPSIVNPNDPDPIASMIEKVDPDIVTGALPAREAAQ